MTKDKNDKSTIDMFDEEEKVLLVCMVRTPDGIILHSKHQHDCVGHTDSNGTYYQLDGGTGGYGSCCNLDKCKSLNLYYGDPHKDLREHFVWGNSQDEHGNTRPFEWLKLKDLTDGHLEALISYTNNRSFRKEINLVMVDEQEYRKESIDG